MIQVKRIYEPKSRSDGVRVLVDRLWPRGLTKAKAGIDEWAKSLSPSAKLRQWFRHDPSRWEEFKRRYIQELERDAVAVSRLADQARRSLITFVYGAQDEIHNNAVVLKAYIEKWLRR